MTEDEAKTKWCPFDHWSASQSEGGTAPKCCASKCMMWHETKKKMPVGTVPLPTVNYYFNDENSYKQHYVVSDNEPLKVEIPAQGYCGLAGKP